jgi:hypothetical protein
MEGLLNPSSILLVFYLYLLARWQYVRRPMLFLLGAAGLVFSMVGLFFTLSTDTVKVAIIFHIIGNLVAFVGGLGACFGAPLPVKLSSNLTQGSTPQ